MRILITGGFGFIGGRLARYFRQLEHQVLLGSRNLDKSPDWLPDAEVAKTDWTDRRALESICNGVGVVIHAAGMNAQDCAADPVAALDFNGLATARLVSAASMAGVRRFIYISTAHVYSNPLLGSITEDTCPRNLHAYGTSHLAGENAVLGASQNGRMEGVVLRLSNAFGVPVHKRINCWMLLVNDLCRQSVETGKMLLNSSGLQMRDFIAMAEVCRVVEFLSTRSFDDPLPSVLNVGSGVSRSVLEMAHLVQQRCQIVLGIEPELRCSVSNSDERAGMLKYRTDKLEKLGFNAYADISDEIDNLLAFCHATFNQNQSLCR